MSAPAADDMESRRTLLGDMQVVILCGGRGTRLQERTSVLPKPLVEIGGMPIVWHVIRIYAAQGFRHFKLLTGYLREQIDQFLDTATWPEGVDVQAVYTGENTPTGGRVHAVSDLLRDGGTFCLTYADGVADVDLEALVHFHHDSKAAATMTVIRPYNQWGVALVSEDGRITGFQEKPRLEHWINGGFFCMEPEVLDYVDAASVLERDPLEELAAHEKLAAYRHHGFWECMDTYKDMIELNDLWATGTAPWRVWDQDDPASS